jgi:hypothetical protein
MEPEEFSGPVPLKRDYSYEAHVLSTEVIQDIEASIPMREFYHESKYRNLGLEYQLLSKITETEAHLQ